MQPRYAARVKRGTVIGRTAEEHRLRNVAVCQGSAGFAVAGDREHRLDKP